MNYLKFQPWVLCAIHHGSQSNGLSSTCLLLSCSPQLKNKFRPRLKDLSLSHVGLRRIFRTRYSQETQNYYFFKELVDFFKNENWEDRMQHFNK
jgi:hypothetical protein